MQSISISFLERELLTSNKLEKTVVMWAGVISKNEKMGKRISRKIFHYSKIASFKTSWPVGLLAFWHISHLIYWPFGILASWPIGFLDINSFVILTFLQPKKLLLQKKQLFKNFIKYILSSLVCVCLSLLPGGALGL